MSFWIFSVKIAKRVHEGISFYTGEMLAILVGLQWVEGSKPLRKIISSDSSSSLFTLHHSNLESRKDILTKIQQALFRVQMMGLTVVFTWVPEHSGVEGNE